MFRLLQLLKYSIQHARLGPAIHACVDGVPIPEAFRQATPLAAIVSYVQDRVQNIRLTLPRWRGKQWAILDNCSHVIFTR